MAPASRSAAGALALVALSALCLALAPAPAGAVVGTLPPCPPRSACDTAWNNMIRGIAAKRNYVQILTRLQIAAANDPDIKSAVFRDGVTFFFPTDWVFANTPSFQNNWVKPLCAVPGQPEKCYTPLIIYMAAIGPYPINRLNTMPANTKLQTIYGSNLQKFAVTGRFRYMIGPQIGCGAQCSATRYGGNIVQPTVYRAGKIVVHGINEILAPPLIWPNGFN